MVLDTSAKTYGEALSEKMAQENYACREIVKEIMNFGVNDRQIINIIHSLALHVEDVETMQTLAAAIKEIAPSSFIAAGEER